jgi:hypothetical protein
MGIPKLMQDLLPYAEEIILGCPREELSKLSLPVIRNVIIDGPSLVYYIYSRLYPRCGFSEAGIDAQPSYTEINAGVVEFLTTLTSRGVDMFDNHSPDAAAS